MRVRGGIRYDHGPLQVGGQLTVAIRQDRVFPTESETGGHSLARLFGAYTVASGGVLHTITARLDNVTDELYRNHLSLIKDFVPEVGRNLKLLYNVKF
jgi:iron complex outermembrane receptor protein